MNEVLRLLRIANDYSIKELAEQLDVSAPYISRIESGEKQPSEQLLNKYADILHIKVKTIKFFDKKNRKDKYNYQDLLLKILNSYVRSKEGKKDN